jgi:hypothetical protein
MSWIKRNLYFVIGSVVALALMGLAGYYLYAKWAYNNEVLTKLNEQYAKLQELNDEKPHPGSASGPVDNIKNAKEYIQDLKAYKQKALAYFVPISPIPERAKLNNQEFTAALRETLDRLQKEAAVASVSLPPDAGGYSFSFTAQRSRMTFATNSLEPLSAQLGEVKAICQVLFAAKINNLDSLRRERVSVDDQSGLVTDYLVASSTTNEFAVLTPYELSFRCFSSELAAVLEGFASSKHAMVVKDINVEPTTGPIVGDANTGAAGAEAVPPGMGGVPGMPGMPGMRGYYPPGEAAAPKPAQTITKGGMPVALDERPLRITLSLNVIKLLPSK